MGEHPIGTGWNKPRKSYESGMTKGTGSQPMATKAHVGSEKRGTPLVSEEGHGHKGQSDGHSVGTDKAQAALPVVPSGSGVHKFREANSVAGDGYGHTGAQRKGVHRLSGVAGAHMLGQKKK